MPRIHILAATLADQIAAGEVVERPASVVKELLENALDAGARAITVEVREGGGELVRVSDDGAGMDREDAQLAVLRHATSKIRAASDLERIATLGFRGEALPSIASVSRLRLVTRTREALEGTEVRVEGGSPPQVGPAGCAVGTAVEVRELFYNTPARKKFLKGSASESAQVSEVCLRAALIDARLRLTLVRDGRRAKEFLPANDWAERARVVLEGKAVRVEDAHRGLTVRALLSAPEEARTGATGLHIFVNGRPVRERNLARSVAFAYGSVLPPGRYPTGVVHLDLDPGEIDVNVHPQKVEVRFQRGREIHELLTRMLSKALGTSAWAGPASRSPSFWRERLPVGPTLDPAPAPSEADPWGLTPMPAVDAGAGAARSAHELHDAQDAGLVRGGLAPAAHPTDAKDGREAEGLASAGGRPLADARSWWGQGGDGPAAHAYELPRGPLYAQPNDGGPRAPLLVPAPARPRALAQVKRLYILAESENGIAVLDQHAADERIQYDRLRRQFAARSVVVQRLLLPERVALSASEAALIESHGDELARAGVEVALIAAETAAVRAIPALLRRAPPERLLRDLLDELSRAGERAFGDAIDTALATMACHGAIRAGDPLSLEECQALLDGLAQIEEFGGHCPHGRPILLELPFSELARKVGR